MKDSITKIGVLCTTLALTGVALGQARPMARPGEADPMIRRGEPSKAQEMLKKAPGDSPGELATKATTGKALMVVPQGQSPTSVATQAAQKTGTASDVLARFRALLDNLHASSQVSTAVVMKLNQFPAAFLGKSGSGNVITQNLAAFMTLAETIARLQRDPSGHDPAVVEVANRVMGQAASTLAQALSVLNNLVGNNATAASVPENLKGQVEAASFATAFALKQLGPIVETSLANRNTDGLLDYERMAQQLQEILTNRDGSLIDIYTKDGTGESESVAMVKVKQLIDACGY